MKLKAVVDINLIMKDDETFEEAENRLYDLLFDGLCRNAEAEVDFWIHNTEECD